MHLVYTQRVHTIVVFLNASGQLDDVYTEKQLLTTDGGPTF